MVGASAAAESGWSRGRDAAGMSIGEVLARLRAEFPDTTISKLRFLEAEGLVEPRRTPAGYRKYSLEDVARLRYVLTAQRDHYLPLRVIRDHLAAADRGETVSVGRPVPPRLRPALTSVGSHPAEDVEPPDTRPWLTRTELLAKANLPDGTLRELEQHGLVRPGNGERYDADALEVAAAAAKLAEYGIQPRHLRAYRAAADREIGLFSQLIGPMARRSGPAARVRAAETVRELATLTERIHAALVRAGLRETLGQ